MKKTKFREAFEILQKNPDIERKELAERVDASRDTIDMYFKRFRDRGMIKVDENGRLVLRLLEKL